MKLNWVLVCLCLCLWISVNQHARSQGQDALTECIELSPLLDDIHSCMDNYLDVMDDLMAEMTGFLAETLSEETLAGLERSQQAFVEYRRQNCLWYLDFSAPRSEAEQIAKNCLALMTQQRLNELQSLITVEQLSDSVLRGYYVYGPDRNSFQPCDSNERYWLEGDLSVVGLVQQSYLTRASTELQILHAVLAGSLDEDAQAPARHAGVVRVSRLLEMRLPQEGDCTGASFAAASSPLIATEPDIASTDESESDVAIDSELPSPEGPEQQLIAYFGAWTADCMESASIRRCRLYVDMNADQSEADIESQAQFAISRLNQSETDLELVFTQLEIAGADLVRWTVDAFPYGVLRADLFVDAVSTRIRLESTPFVQNELLPMMKKGQELKIDIVESEADEDEQGVRFRATLLGLTKALMFADDFVRDVL